MKTLWQFARELVAETPARLITTMQRRELISQIVQQAKHRSSLGPLEPLCVSSALLDLLCAKFAELRSLGANSAAATALLKKTDGAVGASLGKLYQQYLERIASHRLIDQEGVITTATERLNSIALQRRWDLLILQPGLNESSPIESGLCRALIAHCDEVVVQAPTALAEEGRSRFPILNRLNERWSGHVGSRQPLQAADPGKAVTNGLSLRISRRLFAADQQDNGPTQADERPEFLLGASDHDTARRAASRVKELLQDPGVHSNDVVVCATNPHHASRLKRALSEYGVPIRGAMPVSAKDAPIVVLYKRLLALVTTDWRLDSLLQLLRSPTLWWRGHGSAGGLFTEQQIAAAERFVMMNAAPSGANVLLRNLGQLASNEKDLSKLAKLARDAHPVLRHLSECLNELPGRATPIGWSDALRKASSRLGVAASETHAELEGLLSDSQSLAKLVGAKERAWTPGQALDWLQEIGSRSLRDSEPASDAGVRVVSPETATTLTMRWLILADASEDAFSAPKGSRREEQELAMLRFFELVRRPSEGLVLAYSAVDDRGEPLRPSPYAQELAQIFGVEEALSEIPRPVHTQTHGHKPLGPRGWRLNAVEELMLGSTSELSGYCGASASGGPALVASLKTSRERVRGDGFGPGRGHALQVRPRSPGHVRTLSFVERTPVRTLRRLPLQVLRGRDPRHRLIVRAGAEAGRTQAWFACARFACKTARGPTNRRITERRDHRPIPRDPGQVAHGGATPAHQRALAAIEQEQISSWIEGYPEKLKAYFDGLPDLDTPITPSLFEARFGGSRREGEIEDTASDNEPLKLDIPPHGQVLRNRKD